MNSFADVTLENEYREKLRFVCQTFRDVFNNIDKSCLFLGNKTHLISKLQAHSSLNWQCAKHQLVADIIIDHCTRAEKKSAGSFFPTFHLVTQSILRNEIFDGFEIKKAMSKCSFRPTWDQVSQYLTQEIPEKKITDVLFASLELAGLEGRVFFEKSSNDVSSVELVNGFNFEVDFPVKVLGRRKDVRCVVIDGFIETVSEVHHLFQKFSETHEPLLLVVRGLAPDVIQTIQTNNLRKTLDVVPVIIKYDFTGINVLGDIALVACTDVVSSMKGQLISGIKYDELPLVRSVSCYDRILTVENEPGLVSARLQVQKLLEKRKEAFVEEIGKIFDARIKSLTPRSVRVRVPPSTRHLEHLEMFDVGLRLVSSLIKRGMFSKDETVKELATFPDRLPTESALVALTFAKSCFDLLNDSSAVIT